MIDIDKLEALAKAATPGPWEASAYGGVHPIGRGGSIVTALTKSGMYDGYAQNASYIAAANPEAVLDLIAEVRALREFHAFFRSRCEGLFAQFGMGAIDLYNAAAIVARKEKAC